MSNPLLHYVSSTATEIPVGSAISNVAGGGLIQIESELISFSHATASMYMGCTRGVAGSTAAAHLKNKAVTLLGLVPAETLLESPVAVTEPTYNDRHSHQSVWSDLTLGTKAGSSDASSPKFLASAMFNLFGDALSAVSNYLAGVLGAYSVTGTKATTYPTGAVMGVVSDGVTDVDGVVTAVIDGDSSVTKANAAFKAMSNNSNVGSGVDYGVDLHCPTHDGFPALAILKADVRCSNQVVWMNGAGAPVDGTTGDNFAQKGSLYTDITNGDLYIQTSAITTPVWKLVTRAA